MAERGPQSEAPKDGQKVAVVEYTPALGGGSGKDYWPGGQVGLEGGDWVVVHAVHGSIAFYPRESVIRAWNEPTEKGL
jgi:hypothetical protein